MPHSSEDSTVKGGIFNRVSKPHEEEVNVHKPEFEKNAEKVHEAGNTAEMKIFKPARRIEEELEPQVEQMSFPDVTFPGISETEARPQGHFVG